MNPSRAAPRRRRRLEHRDRRAVAPEPHPAQRGGDGVHGGASRRAITVVVDATFGHRIDKKEVRPSSTRRSPTTNSSRRRPGRSGAATRSCCRSPTRRGASILSNDSFQEFHGDYEWLFDEGRLIGGKPVPHVGWVFVEPLAGARAGEPEGRSRAPSCAAEPKRGRSEGGRRQRQPARRASRCPCRSRRRRGRRRSGAVSRRACRADRAAAPAVAAVADTRVPARWSTS